MDGFLLVSGGRNTYYYYVCAIKLFALKQGLEKITDSRLVLYLHTLIIFNKEKNYPYCKNLNIAIKDIHS